MLKATILTDDGVLARVTLDGDRYEVDPSSVRKAALDSPSVADALTTLANLPLDEQGTARVDLV